jgi:hypothetical protein
MSRHRVGAPEWIVVRSLGRGAPVLAQTAPMADRTRCFS